MSISYEAVLDDVRSKQGGELRTLNVGCGRDVRSDAVNVDSVMLPGVDVVAALGEVPLPFDDSSFDLVICKDVLEHTDIVPSMRDLHRVLKPGGRLVISTVHFTSRDTWLDPTHIRGFSVGTFDFFVTDGRKGERDYYFEFHFSEVEQSLIQFRSTLGKGRFLVWDRIVEPIVNVRRSVADLFELTGLSRAFPAANAIAVLRK